jgi:hypothetical protein
MFDKFKKYKVLMENETNMKINILQSNNGKKIASKKFNAFLGECGIQQQTSVSYP